MANFDPREHLTKIQGRDYLEVKWRIVWFRDIYPQGTITTDVHALGDLAYIRARVIVDGLELASGIATLRAAGDREKTWAGRELEKAETAAIGRALANAGYGTQFTDEIEEDGNLADSPIERKPKPAPSTPAGQPPDTKRTPANGNGNTEEITYWYVDASKVEHVIDKAKKDFDIQVWSDDFLCGQKWSDFATGQAAYDAIKACVESLRQAAAAQPVEGAPADEPPTPSTPAPEAPAVNAHGIDLSGENKELRMIRRIIYNGTARGSSRWSGIVDDHLRITLWPEDMKLLANMGHLPDDQEPELIQDLPPKDEAGELSIPVYAELSKNDWRITAVEPPETMPVWAQPANLWVEPDKLEKGDIIHLRKGRPHKVVTRGLRDVTAIPCHEHSGYDHTQMKTLKFAAGQLVPVERKAS